MSEFPAAVMDTRLCPADNPDWISREAVAAAQKCTVRVRRPDFNKVSESLFLFFFNSAIFMTSPRLPFHFSRGNVEETRGHFSRHTI